MAKAYWVVCYRKIKDPAKMAAYSKLAGPAVAAAGGKFVVRGTAAAAHEQGVKERTVISEWPSLQAATAFHDSAPYQEALRALGDGAERDFRICEGYEG